MKITINGKRFVDENGNQILFNGTNVVCKDPQQGYFFPGLEQAFQRFREQGFNLIRLGIFWDAVEPQPGTYDEQYLAKVKETVELAWKYGLCTVLDMHQDLFSRKWGDGAPLWATLDEGADHPEHCTMWYEAYLQSDAIILAADNFWRNARAADGVGLLDHYAAMWGKIAEVFAGCESVIGFEPMNEPFMGSLARAAFGEAEQQTAARYPDYDPQNPMSMTAAQEAFYMGIVTEKLLEFDRTTLMDFYRRIRQAVEPVSDKPIVTGGNIYSSSNVPTGIGRLDTAGNQIYAPHGYDAVVDSDCYESFNKENIEHLFADKRRSQEEMDLPVLIGEWGAFPSRSFTNDLIRHMNGILEEYLWSSAYWQWQPGQELDPNYDALSRAYPMQTAGEVQSYRYNDAEKSFSLCYRAEAGGVTKIYCPFRPKAVEGDRPIKYEISEFFPSGSACYVLVTAEENGTISLTVH